MGEGGFVLADWTKQLNEVFLIFDWWFHHAPTQSYALFGYHLAFIGWPRSFQVQSVISRRPHPYPFEQGS